MKKYTEDPQWMTQLLEDLQDVDNASIEQINSLGIHISDGEIYIDFLPRSIEDRLFKLISDDFKRVDDKAISFFREYGFDILPGERDKFGWLTSHLQFPKLDLIFSFGWLNLDVIE